MIPKISVIMATYNHAPFVAQSIESVLDQDFEDFEFLIADDGSSDSTRDVVAGFTDPRIRFFPHAVNRGACMVTNELIAAAKAPYVALLNSDDFWPSDKLSFQYAFMEEHGEYAAMFGNAQFIDREGQPIPASTIEFGDIFKQPNRPRGHWLRRFFEKGNCLCHPTILIRRECYGVLDNRLRQLPDLDLWIRFSKRYKFHVTDRTLINFRLLPGENVSSQTRPNIVRTMNEHFLIAQTFFDGMTRDLLIEGFSDLLVHKDVPTPIHEDIEKALLYFADTGDLAHTYRVVGIEKLHALLASDRHRPVLLSDYGIDDRSFQTLMAEADAFRPLPPEPMRETVIEHVPLPLHAVAGRELLHEVAWRIKRRIKG